MLLVKGVENNTEPTQQQKQRRLQNRIGENRLTGVAPGFGREQTLDQGLIGGEGRHIEHGPAD